MTDRDTTPPKARKKQVLAIAATAIVGFALLLAWIMLSTASSETGGGDSDSLARVVATAMAGADAEIGERLVTETDCASCHLTGDGGASPRFDGLADVAGARRPSLSAAQYLYEAIVSPGAHLVDGYAKAMPNDYGQRYSAAELGHMIAYLLTFTDEA